MRSPSSLASGLFPKASIPRGYAEGGGLNHYQWRPGDGLQRPLRSRFQPRLRPSVGPLCLSDVECRMAEYKKNHSVPRFMLEYWVDPSTPHRGIHVHEIATRRTYVSTEQSKKPFSFAITTDLYIHTTNGSRAVGLERW